jgi:hypothetical protein
MSSPLISSAATATATAKTCIALTKKGILCTLASVDNDRCKKHHSIYERENPAESVMLVPSTTKNAQAVMQVFNKCRNKADYAFLLMYGTRKIYNPSFNLNKFITGGCAEEALYLLFNSEGIACKNVSLETTLIDLTLNVTLAADTHLLEASLKNSSSIHQSPILENYRGQKHTVIRPLPPTFIIYTEDNESNKRFRIVYLDHDIIKQAYPDLSDEELNAIVYKNSDSNLAFKSNFLPSFIPRLPKEYILNANFPKEEDLKKIRFEDKRIIIASMKESKQQLEKNGIQAPDGFFPDGYLE